MPTKKLEKNNITPTLSTEEQIKAYQQQQQAKHAEQQTKVQQDGLAQSLIEKPKYSQRLKK